MAARLRAIEDSRYTIDQSGLVESIISSAENLDRISAGADIDIGNLNAHIATQVQANRSSTTEIICGVHLQRMESAFLWRGRGFLLDRLKTCCSTMMQKMTVELGRF